MISNKKGSITLASLLALAGAGAVVDTAEAAAYVKLGDIKGEAKGFIPLTSWSWGIATKEGGRRGESACFTDISFSKKFDSSTGQMLEALAEQTTFPGAFLSVRDDSDGRPILEIDLQPSRLTSYSVSYDGFGGMYENFTLRFSDADGTIDSGFGTSGFLITGEPCN